MTDFTPGPWEVRNIDDGRLYVLDGKGYDICVVRCLGPKEEDNANAALIASAPDLYAACESALEHITDALLYPDDDDLVIELQAALRKVRGEGQP